MWTGFVTHLCIYTQTHIRAHTLSDSNMPTHTFAKQANTFSFGVKRITLTSTQAHLDWLRFAYLEWLLWLNLSFWVIGTVHTLLQTHCAVCASVCVYAECQRTVDDPPWVHGKDVGVCIKVSSLRLSVFPQSISG